MTDFPSMPARDDLMDAARRLSTTAWSAGAILLAFYALLSLSTDPGGYLGTDTGAKVYTLAVMDQQGTAEPDVGYWAQVEDPDGRLHPLYQTAPRSDGSWVAVTTLPVLEAARPLYAIGGYRLALLLPMLGAVGTAFAARSVARHLGTDVDGWRVFWVVGAGSPIVVYALDFWEHSLGVACIVGAVALLLDVLQGRSPVRALAAGALLGFGAVLRNETFVYTLVSVGVVCLAMLLGSRSIRQPVVAGAATIGGFAVPWIGNLVLEGALDGQSRADRASGTAARVGDDSGDRVREAFQTLLGLNAGTLATSVLLGAAVVLVILLAFRGEARGDTRFSTVCLVGAGVAYFATAIGGLGFISGMLPAFPLAVAGLVQANRSSTSRLVAVIALGSLPIVYAFQYVGGGAPQWGGRYTLASSVLLGVVGVVGLVDRFPRVSRGIIALSVGVTALGVAWLGVRSHGVDEFFEDVRASSDGVVISRNAFLIREGGAASIGERWLSTKDEETFQDAIAVARAIGENGFSVLEWGGEAPPQTAIPDDVVETERILLEFVDVPVGLVTYEFSGADA